MEQKLLDRITEIIPESTYDVISRIVPGVIVVAAAYSYFDQGETLEGHRIVEELRKSLESFGMTVVFLAFAYVSGLAMSAFAQLLHAILWVFEYPILRATGALKLARIGELKPEFSNRIHELALSSAYEECRESVNDLRWRSMFLGPATCSRIHSLSKAMHKESLPVMIKLVAEVGLLYNLAVAVLITWPFVRIPWYVLVGVASSFLLAGFIRSIRTWIRHMEYLRIPPATSGPRAG